MPAVGPPSPGRQYQPLNQSIFLHLALALTPPPLAPPSLSCGVFRARQRQSEAL